MVVAGIVAVVAVVLVDGGVMDVDVDRAAEVVATRADEELHDAMSNRMTTKVHFDRTWRRYGVSRSICPIDARDTATPERKRRPSRPLLMTLIAGEVAQL